MLVVKNIRRGPADGCAELRATVSSGRKAIPAQDIWFRYPPHCLEALSPTSDAFVAGTVLAAMRLGMPLHVEGVISEKMAAGAHQFMEIAHRWWPQYRPVPIRTDGVAPAHGGGERVASFFSGGVDSFYTVLRSARPDVPPDRRIDTLLFVWGFDVRITNEPFYRTVHDHLAAAAADLGKKLLCVSTNLRGATRRVCTWRHYYGQALAGTALGLAGLLRRVYIPATYAIHELAPHGSHPSTDPLWSTETLDVVHDGCETARIDKVLSEIARSPVTLAHLRVCWENHDGQYNCGKCEKCIRTKISLAIAGVLPQCQTFDGLLNYDDVAKLVFADCGLRLLAQENLEAAIARGADPRLIQALAHSLSRSARMHPRYWPLYAKKVSRALRRRLFGGLFEKATWNRRRRAV